MKRNTTEIVQSEMAYAFLQPRAGHSLTAAKLQIANLTRTFSGTCSPSMVTLDDGGREGSSTEKSNLPDLAQSPRNGKYLASGDPAQCAPQQFARIENLLSDLAGLTGESLSARTRLVFTAKAQRSASVHANPAPAELSADAVLMKSLANLIQ